MGILDTPVCKMPIGWASYDLLVYLINGVILQLFVIDTRFDCEI